MRHYARNQPTDDAESKLERQINKTVAFQIILPIFIQIFMLTFLMVDRLEAIVRRFYNFDIWSAESDYDKILMVYEFIGFVRSFSV